MFASRRAHDWIHESYPSSWMRVKIVSLMLQFTNRGSNYRENWRELRLTVCSHVLHYFDVFCAALRSDIHWHAKLSILMTRVTVATMCPRQITRINWSFKFSLQFLSGEVMIPNLRSRSFKFLLFRSKGKIIVYFLLAVVFTALLIFCGKVAFWMGIFYCVRRCVRKSNQVPQSNQVQYYTV